MSAPDSKIESILRQLQSRQGRKKMPYCLAEGYRCCTELLARAADLVECAIVRDDVDFKIPSHIDVYRATERFFEKNAPTVQSQGVMLIVKKPQFLDLEEMTDEPYILVLDQITDPGNLGTIFRTAVASGIKEIWLTKGCCDPFSDKVIRSAMSIQFSLKLRQFETLQNAVELAPKLGYNGAIYITSPHEGKNLFTTSDLFEKSLIVFGNEANGITQKPTPHAQWVTIPMLGNEESLNVAQAATIFLFESVRRLTTKAL